MSTEDVDSTEVTLTGSLVDLTKAVTLHGAECEVCSALHRELSVVTRELRNHLDSAEFARLLALDVTTTS